MGKRGNGVEKSEGGQTALDLEQEAPDTVKESSEPEAEKRNLEAPAADLETGEAEQETAEPAPAVNAVAELGNTSDACWKVLADGERIEISDQEWRKELTRLLAPTSPRAS